MAPSGPSFKTPQINGSWKHIFDPNQSKFTERFNWINRTHWYTNDHTLVKAADGSWHTYGIIGYRILKQAFAWIIEQNLFHISSPTLYVDSWTEHDYSLTADRKFGEKFLWAPHALNVEGKLYMYYSVGNIRPLAKIAASHGNIHLATSSDGVNWERDKRNPQFSGPGHARDTMVLQVKDEYYIYYTQTVSDRDLHSCIAVRKSTDLHHWSGPKIAQIQPWKRWHWAGNAESPFVVHQDGIFYLFTCLAQEEYNRTAVYWSQDPEHFPLTNHICDLPTHASEIIYDEQEGWFITTTGWDKKGLYIAPLSWG